MKTLEKPQVLASPSSPRLRKTHKHGTFTSAAEDRTIAIRCKWTNAAYADSPKTGKRAVTVDTVTE